MGKFHQVYTKLWPLIDVKIVFTLLYLEHLLTDFFKLCTGVDIWKKWYGTVDR